MAAKAGTAAIADSKRRIRRHPRYSCNFSVTVKLFAGDRYQHIDGNCKDLSQAGMGLLLAAELAEGEVLSLNFSLPGLSQKWDVRAILRHRRGYHYGLEFVSLPSELTQTVLQVLQKLKPCD
jgi:hypothetical protein